MNLFRDELAHGVAWRAAWSEHWRWQWNLTLRDRNFFRCFMRKHFAKPTDKSDDRARCTSHTHEHMRDDACKHQRAAKRSDERPRCWSRNRA